MKVGDRVQVTAIGSSSYLKFGVVKGIGNPTMYGTLIDVLLDGDTNTSFLADMWLTVVGALAGLPPQTPPPQKYTVSFRFKSNPKAYVTLMADGPRWIVIDCFDDKFRGVTYDSMEQFLMIHNDSGVYEVKDLPAKSCSHVWKERILFVSIEEYCINCPAYRPKKAS